MGGALQKEWERSRGKSPGPLSPWSLQNSQASPLPSKFPSSPWVHWSWGHRKKDKGRTGEAGGRGPLGQEKQEEQERRGGHLPCPLEPRKAAGLPGPQPSEARSGGHALAPSVP